MGLLAGFLHSSVALNVGIVYGGMNLYNNGFAGGIVAIFMVPVIHSIRDRRARAKGRFRCNACSIYPLLFNTLPQLKRPFFEITSVDFS